MFQIRAGQYVLVETVVAMQAPVVATSHVWIPAHLAHGVVKKFATPAEAAVVLSTLEPIEGRHGQIVPA